MTAVEFLVKEINKLTGLTIAMDEPCVNQAKEMEKEQIIKAFYSHVSAMSHDDLPAGEKYYKDTYNSSPSSEWDAVDKCPSCGSPCNIYSDLDENDNCNDCRN